MKDLILGGGINYLANRLLGTGSFTEEQILAADVNGDGYVNIADIVEIVSHIMSNTGMTPEQGEQIIDEVEDLIMDDAPPETQEPTIPIVDVPVVQPQPVKPPVRPDRPRRPDRPGKPADEKQQLIDKILNKQRRRK